MPANFPKGFDEWFFRPPPGGEIDHVNYKTFADADITHSKKWKGITDRFFHYIQEKGRDNPRTITIPEHGSERNFYFPFEDRLPSLPTDEEYDDAQNFAVQMPRSTIKISGAVIRRLEIPSSIINLAIENSYVGMLELPSNHAHDRTVTILNCWIGVLHAAPESVHDLVVSGGGIGVIKCSPPDGKNPFLGSILFKGVAFPSSRSETRLFSGAQPYRNIRSHMEKLNNGPMAAMFRTLELRCERKEADRGISWLLNILYDWASVFGSAIGRPLLWALAIYALGVVYAFCFDTGATPLSPNIYVGWRENLVSTEYGHIWRSFFLPLQSMISPAGFLGTRSLVTAETAIGGAFFTVVGIAMDAMIFLSILAIRKRFKLP